MTRIMETLSIQALKDRGEISYRSTPEQEILDLIIEHSTLDDSNYSGIGDKTFSLIFRIGENADFLVQITDEIFRVTGLPETKQEFAALKDVIILNWAAGHSHSDDELSRILMDIGRCDLIGETENTLTDKLFEEVSIGRQRAPNNAQIKTCIRAILKTFRLAVENRDYEMIKYCEGMCDLFDIMLNLNNGTTLRYIRRYVGEGRTDEEIVQKFMPPR